MSPETLVVDAKHCQGEILMATLETQFFTAALDNSTVFYCLSKMKSKIKQKHSLQPKKKIQMTLNSTKTWAEMTLHRHAIIDEII